MIGKNLSIQGLVHVRLEQDGEIIQECRAPNRIVNGGLDFLIDWLTLREYPPSPANPEKIGAVKYGDDATATTATMVDIQGTQLSFDFLNQSKVAALVGRRMYGGAYDFHKSQVLELAQRHQLGDPPLNVVEVDLDMQPAENDIPGEFIVREIGLFASDYTTGSVIGFGAKYSINMTPTIMVARVVVPDFVVPASPEETRIRSRWFFAMGNVPAGWETDPYYFNSIDWFADSQ